MTDTPGDDKPARKPAARARSAGASSAAKPADGEAAVQAALAQLPEADRLLGERLHAIVRASAPGLTPKLWYGMPAYARDGKVLCFFQAASKFQTRYATFGFQHEAHLDDGPMWPVAFALTEVTDAVAEQIAALVQRAVAE